MYLVIYHSMIYRVFYLYDSYIQVDLYYSMMALMGPPFLCKLVYKHDNAHEL